MTAATHSGKNVIAFAFAINQRVTIDAIDVVGVVQGLMVTSEGIEYLVAYFNDDKDRRKEWLGGSEISRR